jgi:putative redox protein
MAQPHSEAPDARKPIGEATVVDAPERYAVHIRTGHHKFAADESVAHGGADTAPNPTQLAIGGLGACTAITLRMYAERHGWAIGRIQVRVELVIEGEQRRIEREVRIEGPLDSEQRARMLEIASKTPVTRMLSEGTPIATELIVT